MSRLLASPVTTDRYAPHATALVGVRQHRMLVLEGANSTGGAHEQSNKAAGGAQRAS